MIDVVPLGPGQWLARCECGESQRFPDAESGWQWVLNHPCDDARPEPETVDLTEPTRTCAHGGGSGI